jgi:hypothetical protein
MIKYSTRIFAIIVFCCASMLHSNRALAGECTKVEFNKGKYFAVLAGQKLIFELGGGKSIRTEVSRCKYNAPSEEFSVNIWVYWVGSLMSYNEYYIGGQLSFSENGQTTQFIETGASQSWIDLKKSRNLASGAIDLGTLEPE